MRLMLVGNFEPTHVGRNFLSAAQSMGIEVTAVSILDAYAGPRLLRQICWHLLGRRAPRMSRFGRDLLAKCDEVRPDLVLTIGIAPLSQSVLLQLRQRGIKTANFLTDDPWNRHHHADWFMKALPCYDHVFTPRRANMAELEGLNGPGVHYLPFAYAPEIHHPPELLTAEERAKWRSEVLFIGGADKEREEIMRVLRDAGLKLSLWGGLWNQVPDLRQFAKGHAGPEEFRCLVANAAVNLCIVRRANRDGHSMRSFELPAVGGCLLVEGTPEHREIFGSDGETVRYFDGMDEMVARARELIADEPQRLRLAEAVRRRIADSGLHSYRDRLVSIFDHCR